MNNLNKLVIIVAFITVTAIFLVSCSKTSDSGYKYPRNFPQECVAVYDRWWILLDKMKATGRFEEESLKEREKSFLSLLEGFKNPPRERTPPVEEYIKGCNDLQGLINMWSKAVENADNMSNEELARTVGGVIKSK